MRLFIFILLAMHSVVHNGQELVQYQVKKRSLPLFDQPEGNLLVSVPKNKTVTILSFSQPCGCFEAEYNDMKGFLPSQHWLHDVFPKIRKQGTFKFPDEAAKKVLLTHNLVLETTENGFFVLAIKPENDAAMARNTQMIRKYGYSDGKKIAEGKLWLGMKTQMVLDSWGIPYRVRRSRGHWGEMEQWIYSSAYLYFENGQLTEILKITSAKSE